MAVQNAAAGHAEVAADKIAGIVAEPENFVAADTNAADIDYPPLSTLCFLVGLDRIGPSLMGHPDVLAALPKTKQGAYHQNFRPSYRTLALPVGTTH